MPCRAAPVLTSLFLLIVVVAAAGCAARHDVGPEARPREGTTVVLWVSVDGLRGDYVDRFRPPFLSDLVARGASTRRLTPVFPSLTFPSHLSLATGAPPAVHGIPANHLYDAATGQTYRFPDDASLVRAEPIWLTAARQGVRVAVIDWPMSQRQDRLPPDVLRAAYFNPGYDEKLTDEQRLTRLLDVYRADGRSRTPGTPPLRLLMGYVHDVDTAGHRFGPGSPQARKAVVDTDALLARVVAGVADEFDRTMRPDRGDRLYVLVTADHGMTTVTTLVSLERLLDGVLPGEATVVNSGTLANIHLDKLPDAERTPARDVILARLSGRPFLRAFARDALPPGLGYAHPTRTGDVVVTLAPGHLFTSARRDAATMPASVVPTTPKGAHGYLIADTTDMLGFAVVRQLRGPETSRDGFDLGPVDALQFHPTVAHLLGISPAAGANQPPLDLSRP